MSLSGRNSKVPLCQKEFLLRLCRELCHHSNAIIRSSSFFLGCFLVKVQFERVASQKCPEGVLAPKVTPKSKVDLGQKGWS